MNINRNTRTTSLLLSNTKTVLNEARLQRFKQETHRHDRRLAIEEPHQTYIFSEESKTPADFVFFRSSSESSKHDTPGSPVLEQKKTSDLSYEASRLRRLTFISGDRLTGSRCSTSQRRNNISNENITIVSPRGARTNTSKNVSREVPDNVSLILQELKQIKKNIATEIGMRREVNNGDAPLSQDEHHRIQSFMTACDMVLESFEKELEYNRSVSRVGQRRTKQQMLNSYDSSKSLVRFDLSKNEVFYF